MKFNLLRYLLNFKCLQLAIEGVQEEEEEEEEKAAKKSLYD